MFKWTIEITDETALDLEAHLRTILGYVRDEVPLQDWTSGKEPKWRRQVSVVEVDAAAPLTPAVPPQGQQRWEYRDFEGAEIFVRLNDPGEAWEFAAPPHILQPTESADNSIWMAVLRRPLDAQTLERGEVR